MSKHNYNSGEYLAQTFTHFVKNPTFGKPQGYAAKQHGARTEFIIGDLDYNINCNLTFSTRGNKPFSILEMKLSRKDGMGDIFEDSVEIPVNIMRGKTGKISGDNYDAYGNYFINRVMKKIKMFYKKSKQ